MAYSHQDNRSSMPNHPANIHSNINPAHLAILFQTCFACGLSAAALLNPQETGHPSNSSIIQLTTTALPFAIGSLLAAAFLPQAIRKFRAISPTCLLILANLCLAAATCLVYVPPSANLPVIVLCHHIIAIFTTIALTTVFSCLRPPRPTLAVALGVAGLGVFVQAATSTSRPIIPLISLANAAIMALIALFNKTPLAKKPGSDYEDGSSHKRDNPEDIPHHQLFFHRTWYLPPPPYRTILAALLAFTSLTAVTVLPAALTSLSLPAGPATELLGGLIFGFGFLRAVEVALNERSGSGRSGGVASRDVRTVMNGVGIVVSYGHVGVALGIVLGRVIVEADMGAEVRVVLSGVAMGCLLYGVVKLWRRIG